MPRAKWTDEIFDAFLAAKPDLTSLLDEDLAVTNYSYEQWFQVCRLYDVAAGGTQEEMAARLVTRRDEALADIDRKRNERDRERGVDILRVRRGQMEIQSTLGKHQKEEATETKQPAANSDHKNKHDEERGVDILRLRKAQMEIQSSLGQKQKETKTTETTEKPVDNSNAKPVDNSNTKPVKHDQERGVDVLRLRKAQMEIQSSLGQKQKETKTTETTEKPVANNDTKPVKHDQERGVDVLRLRKAQMEIQSSLGQKQKETKTTETTKKPVDDSNAKPVKQDQERGVDVLRLRKAQMEIQSSLGQKQKETKTTETTETTEKPVDDSNAKPVKQDQERGVDVLRLRKAQMEIQSTLGKQQKETSGQTETTKKPVANNTRDIRDSVDIMRERKAKEASNTIKEQSETDKECVADEQEEPAGQTVEGIKELEAKYSEASERLEKVNERINDLKRQLTEAESEAAMLNTEISTYQAISSSASMKMVDDDEVSSLSVPFQSKLFESRAKRLLGLIAAAKLLVQVEDTETKKRQSMPKDDSSASSDYSSASESLPSNALLDRAMEKGDWKAVGKVAASIVSIDVTDDKEPSRDSDDNETSRDSFAVRTERLDNLISSGDWSGLANTARKYGSFNSESESDSDDEKMTLDKPASAQLEEFY